MGADFLREIPKPKKRFLPSIKRVPPKVQRHSTPSQRSIVDRTTSRIESLQPTAPNQFSIQTHSNNPSTVAQHNRRSPTFADQINFSSSDIKTFIENDFEQVYSSIINQTSTRQSLFASTLSPSNNPNHQAQNITIIVNHNNHRFQPAPQQVDPALMSRGQKRRHFKRLAKNAALLRQGFRQ